MEPRIFGKDVTNLADQDPLRYKRNYSFLHGERLRDLSLNPKPGNHTNRTLNNRSIHDSKPVDTKPAGDNLPKT